MNLHPAFFLRAKHWQIFLFLVAVLCMGALAEDNLVGEQSVRRLGDSSLLLLGVLAALQMLGFLSWFWSIGSFFCSIVRTTLRPKTRFFNVAVAYPVIYGFTVPKLFQSGWSAVILPLHLFAMICLIYVLYFVSKCLALAETDRPEAFPRFAGTFLLLWFFPIGVWIVQPKVNRLYLAKERSNPVAL
jgi:hypothetical protein